MTGNGAIAADSSHSTCGQDTQHPTGVTYTPRREEAVAAVDRGDAEAAFLLRPTRIEDVWEVARRGDVMPQKSTFFYPKLTSGLLMLPLD